LLLLAVPLCLAAQNWQPLFDGKTANGWIEVTGQLFPTDTWRTEDGCLRAIPGEHGHQDIRTVATYRWYEFEFSWRILKDGNSGVKYLVQNTDRWTNAQGLQARARGPEYQLVDDASDDAQERARVTGSLYSVFPPTTHPAHAPGEWNQSRIVVRRDSVEHWLNGQRVLSYRRDDPKVIELLRLHRKGPDIVDSSFISLQNHGTPVWFRDLKIRILE